MSTSDYLVDSFKVGNEPAAGLLVIDPKYRSDFFEKLISYWETKTSFELEKARLRTLIDNFNLRQNPFDYFANSTFSEPQTLNLPEFPTSFSNKEEPDMFTEMHILDKKIKFQNNPDKRGAIKHIFTTWVRYLLPVPAKADSPEHRKVLNALLELVPNNYSMTIKNTSSSSKNTIYDTIKLEKYINNAKDMTNIAQFVYHMVFNLCTPNDILKNRLLYLKSKGRIFIVEDINQGCIEDRNNIFSIADELNLRDQQDNMKNVYKIPINILRTKINIPKPSFELLYQGLIDEYFEKKVSEYVDKEINSTGVVVTREIQQQKDDLEEKIRNNDRDKRAIMNDAKKELLDEMKETMKYMEKGLEIIRFIIKKFETDQNSSEEIPKDLKKFKDQLSKTEGYRSFFMFLATKHMFPVSSSYRSFDEFYTFYDILCNQYFQEYRENIHKEHFLIASKLKTLADYAITFDDDDVSVKTNIFNLFLSVFEFALKSSFCQGYVTSTCNMSLGDNQRSDKTIDQYVTIVEFVCKLYYCTKYKIPAKLEYNQPKINKDCTETDGTENLTLEFLNINDIPKTVDEYRELMHENSQNFVKNNREQEFIKKFNRFPTILVPEDFENDTGFKENDNPIMLNFNYVCNIGKYLTKSNRDMEYVKNLARPGGDTSKRIKQLKNYVKRVDESFFMPPRDQFGAIFKNKKPPNLEVKGANKTKEVPKIPPELPKDVGFRIRTLNNLLYKLKFQRSLYDRLLDED